MKPLVRLLFLVLVLAPAPLALALCHVPQPRLVCAEYFASPLVVEATLIQTHILGDKADPRIISAYVYTMRVNKVLRGNVKGQLRIYEGNDSGRVAFDWIAGREYLLFLSYDPQDNAWELDGCGNSGPLDAAKAALTEIEAIKAAHDGGVIYGMVSQQSLAIPIPGVHVEAQGEMGKYAAVTNAKGEFQVKVPAGRYSVRVVDNKAHFAAADITYEAPWAIQIESGGCAQVQIAEFEP